ncbi:MAG: hypothetical protein IPG22_05700 [Acidobacteria bacterium]|nr:hypothetical protein [Acidobacteriota bacterium]
MEQETDFFHVFTQHQLIIFVGVSLLIIALLVGIGFLLGKLSERRSKEAQNENREQQSVGNRNFSRVNIG